ncbi:hypothetical protein ACP4OV_027059 [Aristida adscensionis]
MPSRGVGGRARRRRARRRRARRRRDWAEGLPTDVLLAILHRLDHAHILAAADRVCRAWRRAARDEPSLWRRITMTAGRGIRFDRRPIVKLNRRGMTCEAARRSAGQCEAFRGVFAGNDGFLLYLSERAPNMKSLQLISCYGVTDAGLTEAVKAFPLLEELEVSFCDNVSSRVHKVVGEVCPRLKRFRLKRVSMRSRETRTGMPWGLQACVVYALCSFSPMLSPTRGCKPSWIAAPIWSPLTYATASTSAWMILCALSVPGSRR